MRFQDEFERLDAELTLAGHVVLTPMSSTRNVKLREVATEGIRTRMRSHVSARPPRPSHDAGLKTC